MKIYVSPSNQYDNPFSADGTNEGAVADRIAQATATSLRAYGYEVRVGAHGATMAQKVAEANAWNADLYICQHTNAGGGAMGTMVICYPGRQSNSFVQGVYRQVAALTPWSDLGIVQRTDLYEINATNAPCVYVETAFHDKPESARWLIDHVAEIGKAFADGVAAGEGRATELPTPAPAPGPLSDGVVGPATISTYQAKHGLPVDGFGGTDTMSSLQVLAHAPYTDGWIDLDDQDQVDLAEEWFPAITVFRVGGGTGGSPSWKAIQQNLLGTAPDGIPGPKDAAAFQAALRDGRL